MARSKESRSRRNALAVTAVVIAAVVATFTSGSASASSGWGSTPGLYAWPAAKPAYKTLIYSLSIKTNPGPNAAIYWAQQFSENGSGSHGTGGYVGPQTYVNGAGANVWRFAAWGATACEPNPAYAGTCTYGVDGSAGESIAFYYKWIPGVHYKIRLQQITGRPGWWNASVRRSSSMTWISMGNLDLGTNTESLSPAGSWVEYINWNNPNATCAEQADSLVTYGPITGDAGTVKWGSGSVSNDCAATSKVTINTNGGATLSSNSYVAPIS